MAYEKIDPSEILPKTALKDSTLLKIKDSLDDLNLRQIGIEVEHVSSNNTIAARRVPLYQIGDASGGSFTTTLPSAVDMENRILNFKKVDNDTHSWTIQPVLGQTLEDDSNYVMVKEDDSIQIVSDGSKWIVYTGIIEQQYIQPDTVISTNSPLQGGGDFTADRTLSIIPLVNGDFKSDAAIAKSKLNLTDSIVNNDVVASAGIPKTKLNLSGSIVNNDIVSGAGIPYSKLSLSGSILGTDFATNAGITRQKLVSSGLLPYHYSLVVSDVTGTVNVSGDHTQDKLQYVAGVTSNIQTQLDDLAPIGNSDTIPQTWTSLDIYNVSEGGYTSIPYARAYSWDGAEVWDGKQRDNLIVFHTLIQPDQYKYHYPDHSNMGSGDWYSTTCLVHMNDSTTAPALVATANDLSGYASYEYSKGALSLAFGFTKEFSSANWVQTGSADVNWAHIRCSSSGQYILGVTGDTNHKLYVSNDYGATFTEFTYSYPTPEFVACAVSGTGQYMIACAYDREDFLYSSNYGVSWSNKGPVYDSAAPFPNWIRYWDDCDIADDGTYVLAGNNYVVKMSGGSGTKTTMRADHVCISRDASVIYASNNEYGDYKIYESTDGGTTWAAVTGSPGQVVSKLATDYDGSTIAFSGADQYIHWTTNKSTWNSYHLANTLLDCVVSSDGNYAFSSGVWEANVVNLANNEVTNTSPDYSLWRGGCASSDFQYLYLGGNSTYIYKNSPYNHKLAIKPSVECYRMQIWWRAFNGKF